jgi:hypothetical protein
MEVAKAQVRQFEARPPAHYNIARPIMRSLLEAGAAHDMGDAYQKAMNLIRGVSDGRGSVTNKLRASNASLSGAPHGSRFSNGAERKFPAGSHMDISEDVRLAMRQLAQ